jgi:hypothetical protein
MEVSGQLQTLAALPPEKEPLVPIGYEAGWAPGRVWTPWSIRKFLVPARNQTPAIQPVACHYTNWAISVPVSFNKKYRIASKSFQTAMKDTKP